MVQNSRQRGGKDRRCVSYLQQEAALRPASPLILVLISVSLRCCSRLAFQTPVTQQQQHLGITRDIASDPNSHLLFAHFLFILAPALIRRINAGGEAAEEHADDPDFGLLIQYYYYCGYFVASSL